MRYFTTLLELLQDPDIKSKVLWEGMAIIRPWDAIPAEVLAMEPHIYDDIAMRNGELDEEQKEVLQVSRQGVLCLYKGTASEAQRVHLRKRS